MSMGWGLGAPWGIVSPWGAPQSGADYGCEVAQSGILSQSAGGNFSTWICAFAEEAGSMLDVLADIVGAYSIEYAVGAQLDTIGSIIGLPRSGFADDRYRTFLLIQRDLLISAATEAGNWTGTTQNVIDICRRFIGPASGDPVVVHAAYPYSFILTVPDVATLLEMQLLASLVTKALYLGVLGQIIFSFGVGGVYCYEVAADTASACLYCYTTIGDTVGAGTYSGVVLIGDP